jgi:hypothetical protein
VQDLAKKSEAEREEVLRKAGAAEESFADVHKMLLALPHVHLNNVRAYVEEEDDIKEQDVLTVEVRSLLLCFIPLCLIPHFIQAIPLPRSLLLTCHGI